MANFFDCRIFIKPQEGHSLPENFRDQFIGEDGEFTYEKTLPPEKDIARGLDYSAVGDVDGDTMSLSLDTPNGPPEAWLDYLAEQNPNLIIECEYYETGYDVTGRLIWANGEWVWDRRADGVSHERREYFGEYLDRDDEDGPEDFPFVHEENRKAVEQLRTAAESQDWAGVMDGLFTARHQLEYFQNIDIEEDALRVGIVAVDAGLALMDALLTDEAVDIAPLAAQFVDCDADEDPEPKTKKDVLDFVETVVTESARILSMAKHHEVLGQVQSLKEKASQEQSA
jgi:hypothetical protein